MNRMLIVDDETMFVNGLAEVLEDSDDLNLEIYRAYSSDEALNWLSRTKIDIVLSDIRMPRMSGLDLQKEIKQQWPSCKVIFLTGYNDFSFAQNALRNGATDYILKTEGDQIVIEKIKQAMELLENESAISQFITKAKNQLQQARTTLQRDYLRDMLWGDKSVNHPLEQQFADLQISLDSSKPVLLVVGKVDKWQDQMLRTDRALFQFAIQNIAMEYLGPTTNLIPIEMDSAKFAWFIQPKEWDDHRKLQLIRFVQGTCEQVQRTCRELLKIKISFSIANKYVDWDQIQLQFEALQFMLNQRLGLEQELLLIDNSLSTPGEATGISRPSQQIRKWMSSLQVYLENNKQASFYQALQELMALPQLANEADQQANVEQMMLKAEIFLSMGSFFLSNIQLWNLHLEMSKQIDLSKLTLYDQFVNWSEVIEYFSIISELIFSIRFSGWQEQGLGLIVKLKAYISEHISEDLSLTRLGEVVMHNPVYLSRLYKQLSGISLSETIAEARMKIAKDMLADPQYKIYEVTAAVGFDSLKYFRKFFKKETNMSPQEYRDYVTLKK